MAKPNYDTQIARIEARRKRAELVTSAKNAVIGVRIDLRDKEYAQALTHARALVAALEALTGDEGAKAAE